MAIAEDKLRNWIEQTRHVAQNVEHPEDLSAAQVLRALEDAIPHLQEEKPIFADMELRELFAAMDESIDRIDTGIDEIADIAGRNKDTIEAIAATTLEKYQPLP